MKPLRLTFFALSFFLMLGCAEELQQEIVSTYSDGSPLKINFVKWEGNDKLVMREVRLFPNGEKEVEGEYDNGKKHGKWVYWYPENGRKWSEEIYANGLRNGKTIVWYKSGKKEYEGFYKNGVPHDKWIYYDEKGDKLMTTYYDNGKKVNVEKHK